MENQGQQVRADGLARSSRHGDGQLLRKYALLLASLTCAYLVVSLGVEVSFFSRERQETLFQLQRQTTSAAADSIERSLREVIQRLDWATPPGRPDSASGLQERQLDYQRVLNQSSMIKGVVYLDRTGRERLRVSDTEPPVVNSGVDRSASQEFTGPSAFGPYFGPVSFERGSEPVMTVAITDPSASGGVTVGRVALKFLSATVADLPAGNRGYAYVTDDRGRLIAHAEMSLVLRNVDWSTLAQVRSALGTVGRERSSAERSFVGRSAGDLPVLASYEVVDGPGWLVFVEEPIQEALSPVYGSLARALALLAAGILASVLAAVFLARRMVTPVRVLREGAARIGAGELDHRIEVRTGDELETLADEFNRMAEHLGGLYAGLERRVAERTEELAVTLRELEIKTRELEVASRHKSEFLTQMSHELRTPLNSVIGFSEVLLQQLFGTVNEKQEDYLRDIRDSGQHLLALINDILDLAKVEAGQMEIERSSFWLPEVLENTLAMFRETAARHEIGLRLEVAPGVGAVEADLRRVRQVLFNLLSNAVKFTPAGGMVALTATAAADLVSISVADTGIGIPLEDQTRIFEPFQQGPGGNLVPEGTGLGLALARSMVELHGGTLSVQSAVGEGSTFAFTLPLRPAGPERAGEASTVTGTPT